MAPVMMRQHLSDAADRALALHDLAAAECSHSTLMHGCCCTAGARDIAADKLLLVQIFAVCPFLAFDATNAQQHFLRFVTRQPGMLGSLATLLGSLPRAVQRWIVSTHVRGLEPHAVDAALGLLQWKPAVNALHLAKHEFMDLSSPAEWWLLKHFGEPMPFTYNGARMHAYLTVCTPLVNNQQCQSIYKDTCCFALQVLG